MRGHLTGGAPARYLLALGSNVPHPRHGRPPQVLAAALAELARRDLTVERASKVVRSAPLGPSRRTYANAAAIIATPLLPLDLLALLKQVERAFGRRRGGRRWDSRVLDLDVILWSGGAWAAPGIVVPHASFRARTFVLAPARAIAPTWRDPITGCTIRQLHARLTRANPLP